MTAQRRAIVEEIVSTKGHIAPQLVAQRVQRRMPGVNDSTVYRTLELLERHGFLSHSHLGSGQEYHRAAEHDHIHLVCSECNSTDALSLEETKPLHELVARHNGFLPDFTHFAISGLCARCQKKA